VAHELGSKETRPPPPPINWSLALIGEEVAKDKKYGVTYLLVRISP